MSVLLVLTAAGCTVKPISTGPVSTGPGTLAAARKYLEGQWNLVSYEIFPPGRPPIQLKGSGTLSYDAFNNLDMEIRVDAPTAEVLRQAGITTENGVLSTKGRTAVDMQQRTLTYVFEGQPLIAASTGPLDPRRPRHWVVDGTVLTLTTRGDDGQPMSVGRWEKVP